ncbi:MAG: hypothetical protein IT444_13625 [Phycisphaeraceae bacterium]|nr:hypothetical protein [Phycisphaeraceae bacterium]
MTTETSSGAASTYVCPQCKQPVRMSGKPKRSFMGFARIPCPSCNTEFRYPLATSTVVVYWLLLLGNVAYLGFVLSQGQGFVPNPIGIVLLIYVVICLVKNSSLKRSVEELGRSAIDVPPAQVVSVEDGMPRGTIRWYHWMFIIIAPYVAFPWGIVNLITRRKRSGLLLLVGSVVWYAIVMGMIFFMSLSKHK